MGKANLSYLNDLLFGLLEEVMDDTDQDGVEKSEAQITRDIQKADYAIKLTNTILSLSRLQLDAYKYENEMVGVNSKIPLLPKNFIEA